MSVSEGPGLGVWDVAPRTGILSEEHSGRWDGKCVMSLQGVGVRGATPGSRNHWGLLKMLVLVHLV